MFSVFTTERGQLIIRTQDIRRIEDIEGGGCHLAWNEEDGPHYTKVQGTAQENLERLIMEDLALQDRLQRAQGRRQGGYPGLPVMRGKAP